MALRVYQVDYPKCHHAHGKGQVVTTTKHHHQHPPPATVQQQLATLVHTLASAPPPRRMHTIKVMPLKVIHTSPVEVSIDSPRLEEATAKPQGGEKEQQQPRQQRQLQCPHRRRRRQQQQQQQQRGHGNNSSSSSPDPVDTTTTTTKSDVVVADSKAEAQAHPMDKTAEAEDLIDFKVRSPAHAAARESKRKMCIVGGRMTRSLSVQTPRPLHMHRLRPTNITTTPPPPPPVLPPLPPPPPTRLIVPQARALSPARHRARVDVFPAGKQKLLRLLAGTDNDDEGQQRQLDDNPVDYETYLGEALVGVVADDFDAGNICDELFARCLSVRVRLLLEGGEGGEGVGGGGGGGGGGSASASSEMTDEGTCWSEGGMSCVARRGV